MAVLARAARSAFRSVSWGPIVSSAPVVSPAFACVSLPSSLAFVSRIGAPCFEGAAAVSVGEFGA